MERVCVLLKDMNEVCKMFVCVYYDFVFIIYLFFNCICKIILKYCLYLFCFVLIIRIINMINLCIFIMIVFFIVVFCDVYESL